MEDKNLTADDRLKIITEVINAKGLYGLLKAIENGVDIKSELTTSVNNPIEKSPSVEIPSMENHPVAEINSSKIESPSIYRSGLDDLLQADNNSLSTPSAPAVSEKSKARVLTNSNIPSGVQNNPMKSNFVDAQIVRPGGSNSKSHQIL